MITITQQPRTFSLSRQKLIYVAYSDEVAQDGFRYGVTVSDNLSQTWEFFLTPNANDYMVFDLQQIVSSNTSYVREQTHYAPGSVMVDNTPNVRVYDVSISEWWMVGGELTENAGSSAIATTIAVAPGFYDPKHGFEPDPEGTNTDVAFTLNSNTKRAMSDRKYDTHIWSYAEKFSITPTTSTIFIPSFETDFGSLGVVGSNSYLSNTLATKLRVTIYSSSGAPTSATDTFVNLNAGTNQDHAYVYPGNLNNNTAGFPKPSNYPNWRFFTVQFLNSSDAIVSCTYVFYNASLWGQSDCRHEKIRLAWANSRAGWDYFNFIKKSEESISVDRKRYQKVIGNYGLAQAESLAQGFTYGAWEGAINERGGVVNQFLTVTSDWISEQEFVFLKYLIASRVVHWVQDDGSFIPVLVEDSDYTMKRERNGKLKNLTLKLKLANQLTY